MKVYQIHREHTKQRQRAYDYLMSAMRWSMDRYCEDQNIEFSDLQKKLQESPDIIENFLEDARRILPYYIVRDSGL